MHSIVSTWEILIKVFKSGSTYYYTVKNLTQNTNTLQITQSQITQNTTPLIFDAPCCESLRECLVRKIYVIGIRNGKPKVLREISAVRCYRGERKRFRFYPSSDVILVSYYRSNRGNHYINVIWKPQNITEDQAKLFAMYALGLYEEEEVIV